MSVKISNNLKQFKTSFNSQHYRNFYRETAVTIVDSTKMLCPLFDEIEILIKGDSPSIFPSLDKT